MSKELIMDDYQQIISLFKSHEIIDQENILKWMTSPRLDIQGALYVLTNIAWDRIKPELTMQATCQFILDYYRRCIVENPTSGDYILNRYEAGWEMANWLKALYAGQPETSEILLNAENLLKEIYIQGDKETKECIINGILEHVFEEQSMVSLFDNWRKIPQLKIAYDEALE